MGVHVARELLRLEESKVIAGARNADQSNLLKGGVDPDRLKILPLDLDDLDSVARFAERVCAEIPTDAVIEAIVCNAGLQLTGARAMSSPQVERTFQVNVLSHVLLVELLEDRMKSGGTVITLGSGTHDPGNTLASVFGFRGAFFPSAEAVAAGEVSPGGSNTQQGMDRYATSKLCAILYAVQMAEQEPASGRRFLCYDPGLMPGTQLARDRSAVERFAWKYVMPWSAYFLPGVSSAEASGQALVRELLLSREHNNGDYLEFTGEPAPRSGISLSREHGDALVEYSRHLLSAFLS